MASIKIAELRPAGSELFAGSESFLNELNDSHEMEHVLGGKQIVTGVIAISFVKTVGNTVNANTNGNANSIFIGYW